MISMCPSGRLSYVAEGASAPTEPELGPEVAILLGGPLWVRGAIRVESADGTAWEDQNRRNLCRCGESKNKPFCDGTHSDLNFDER